MLYRFRGVAFLAITLFAVVGCSKDSKHSTVNGTVTLDGQPLAAGIIRFEPADGRTATADAPIKDGKFSATVPPGDKRVTISASKVTGKRRVYETPNSPMIDIVEELLPARYNSQSTLKLTVAPGDQTPPPYELKSK